MRECLGWVTSCSNDQSCPQNWLEHAVIELPIAISCHVCGRTVSLVDDERNFESAVMNGGIAAFPIVPPIGIQAQPPLLQDEPYAEFSPRGDPVRASTPIPTPRQWLCTLANGETIRVDRDAMVIGRSRTCDIVIPSAKVSRQHASVSFSGGELWIEDLGSANGVWQNGEKITRTKVGNGDTFTISDETLLFEVR